MRVSHLTRLLEKLANQANGLNMDSSASSLTIAKASRLIRARKLSPVELLESVIKRLELTENSLHAYSHIMAERAFEAARDAESRIVRGAWKGPLHGIPVALKDVYGWAGFPLEAGSKILLGHISKEDSGVTLRLKDAGAVILGKTATPEFALHAYSSIVVPPRNPWNHQRDPGGSSTGSAVAVAAGSAIAALGTDGGGSIRKPASLNGVVGLKPTFGRVTKRGVIPVSGTMDHCGPLTRTVEDAAHVMNALSGYDSRDPLSIDVRSPDFLEDLHKGVERIRLGVLSDFLYSIEVDPVVRQVIESALETFKRLGARLIEVSIPHIDEAVVAAPLVVLADAAAYHQKWLRDRGSEYVSGTRNMLRLGELILATDYLRALHIRGKLKLAMKEVFDTERLSALVMPCLAHSSEPLVESRHEDNESDGHEFMAWNRNCIPFNSTGQPAITLPAGFDDHGVPVGLQIVGRPFDETTVLRIAQAYETATPWHLESAPDIVATN